MDTKKEFKYWPKDVISVISESVLPMLNKNDYHEDGQDFNNLIRLTILGKCITIPKYLTSEKTLIFLGFTQSRAKILWQHLTNVPKDMNGPNIENGSGFYFWRDLMKILEVQIANTMENENDHNRKYTRKVLDNIGLTNEAQFQDIKLKTDGGEAIVTLRYQIPKNTIIIAKQYIKYRWEMLIQLNDIITKKGDWKKEIVMKFTQDPIDLTTLYFPKSDLSNLRDSST